MIKNTNKENRRSSTMKKKIIITIIVIVLLSIVYGYWWAKKQSEKFNQALSNAVYKHHSFVVKTDTIFDHEFPEQVDKRQKILAYLNEQQNNIAMGVWANFEQALQIGNMDYLLANSLETLQCTDCKDKSDDASRFPAREVFTNKWLQKMLLSDQNPSIYIDENQIKVSFSSDKGSSAESSLTVFSFVYQQNKYLFEGMFTVP